MPMSKIDTPAVFRNCAPSECTEKKQKINHADNRCKQEMCGNSKRLNGKVNKNDIVQRISQNKKETSWNGK